VHADSSTGSELKVVEEACREALRTVEAFPEAFSKSLLTFILTVEGGSQEWPTVCR
jgi:hypothetical protein